MSKEVKIVSNDGKQKLEFRLKKVISIKGEDHFLFELKLSSTFWNREALLQDEGYFDSQDRDFTFYQVIFNEVEWNKFCNLLNDWRENNELLFNMPFTTIDGLMISTSVYVSDELISSKDKPVFKFAISNSKFNLEWKSIIDSTSIIY